MEPGSRSLNTAERPARFDELVEEAAGRDSRRHHGDTDEREQQQVYLDSARVEYARQVLSPARCPYQDHQDVVAMQERVMVACRRTKA